MNIQRRAGLAVLSGLAANSFAGSAFGQGGPSSNPRPSQPEQEETDARSTLQNRMSEYITGFRRRFARESGLIVGSGIGQVRQLSDHPDWVKLRSLAFEQAVLEAQRAFVIAGGARIAGDSALSLFRAANQEPPSFQRQNIDQPGVLPDLTRRILAVARGRLDNELRELGIDPVALERVPEAQRHVQFANELQLNAVRRAFGELVGTGPIRTFEESDGKGQYYIGAVVAGSHRRKSIAQQILTRQGQFEPIEDPDKRTDLGSLVTNLGELVDDFGVRLIDDENGLPVLVSFYQWGVDYQGTDRARAGMARQAAEAQAEAQADRQIAEFLAANAEFAEAARAGVAEETAALRNADGSIGQQPTITSLTDRVWRSMRRQARVDNLPGIYTLRNWSARHPESNQRIIGCVRVWSAVSEIAMREYRNAPRPTATIVAPTAPSQGRPSSRSSRELVGGRDF